MSRTTIAGGFLLDAGLIGPDEASRRVIEHWQPGSSLRVTASGRWLLLLATPVRVRLDRAPGWPIEAGTITDAMVLPDGVPVRVSALADIEPHLDLEALPLVRLRPIEAAPAPITLPPPPAEPLPDLRAVAAVALPDTATRRLGRAADVALFRRIDLIWSRTVIVVITAGLATGFAWLAHDGEFYYPIGWAIIVGFALGRALMGSADQVAPSGGSPAHPRRWLWSKPRAGVVADSAAAPRRSSRTRPPNRLRQWVERTAIMSPLSGMISRRHAAYLSGVATAFQRREWDRALREAIALGGIGGVLSIALPQARRGALGPAMVPTAGGRGLAVSGIAERFSAIYREAADRLEAAGEIEKAAFVLADLLDTPVDAVHLLERHGRHDLAARLAEGRRLETALVVRLWWRAGRHQRAIDIAELRDAFPAVLARLDPGQRELAHELRSAWVRARREAGDRIGAIAAAWPDPELRPAAIGDIQAAMALGGAPAAQALPYLLNLRPNDAARDVALALMSDPDPALHPARDTFLTAYAHLGAADPVHDRQLATAAIRALTTRVPAHRTVREALARRADRLAVADAPKSVVADTGRLTRTLPSMPPGDLPVHDAVWINGRILLALGGHGARLVSATGRELVHWDIPTHRIIPADSGTRVLLVTVADEVHELHRLDLADRRVTRWTALRSSGMATGYDGSILTIVDTDGIAFVRTDDTPRVIWRELDARHRVGPISRTGGSLSALVGVPEGGLELWRWSTPSMLLRQRPRIRFDRPTDAVVLASGYLITADDRGLFISGDGITSKPVATVPSERSLAVSGDTYTVTETGDDGLTTVTIRVGVEAEPVAKLRFPERPDRMRATPEHALFTTAAGRVTVLSVRDRSIVADFRTVIR